METIFEKLLHFSKENRPKTKNHIKLYSPVCGVCVLDDLKSRFADHCEPETNDVIVFGYKIIVKDLKGNKYVFDENGFLKNPGEWGTGNRCLLFPSETCKDWENFNPEIPVLNFEPFDKVICRNFGESWKLNFFSHGDFEGYTSYHCIDGWYDQCFPYDESLKEYLGTIRPYFGY